MLKIPRILIVAEHASAQFGGEAALALHYYRVLRARLNPVWLLVHERTRAELLSLFPDDVDHIVFIPDTRASLVLYQFGQRLPEKLASFSTGFIMRILNQLTQRRIVKRLIKDKQISVIHQPMPVSPKEPSIMFGFGVPVIIGPMNGGMNFPTSFQEMQGIAERTLMSMGRATAGILNILLPGKRLAYKLLVANIRTRQALPRGIDLDRVEILVENGVDLSLWWEEMPRKQKSVNDITEFVFLGRLVDWKAVDFLIRAFSVAVKDRPMVLSIIGDGVERASLERLTAELNLTGGSGQVSEVRFLGWLSQAKCAEHLRNADVLVLPSLLECGGAVVLEAMAMSIPVIATNWGGPADYLDDTCGILLEPTTKESFLNDLVLAMKKMALSPEARIKMGQAGRAKIETQFDWEIKVDCMMSYYMAEDYYYPRRKG